MEAKRESIKIGIMQPYFFPYIGYWQLLNLVDKYVIYDDVNFIKGGWINRNRILVNGNATFFNVPMIGASSFKLINEIVVNKDEKLLHKNLKTIYELYKKAPYFLEIYPLIEEILSNKEDILMFNGKEKAKILLSKYNLINNRKGKQKILI